MGTGRIPLPRPETPCRVLARNRRVLADWEQLLRTKRDRCRECSDQIANTPLTPKGSRYLPLKGTQKWVEFEGQRLPQWQWEIDRGARVKVGVGQAFVVVVAVSTGHPKENE